MGKTIHYHHYEASSSRSTSSSFYEQTARGTIHRISTKNGARPVSEPPPIPVFHSTSQGFNRNVLRSNIGVHAYPGLQPTDPHKNEPTAFAGALLIHPTYANRATSLPPQVFVANPHDGVTPAGKVTGHPPDALKFGKLPMAYTTGFTSGFKHRFYTPNSLRRPGQPLFRAMRPATAFLASGCGYGRSDSYPSLIMDRAGPVPYGAPDCYGNNGDRLGCSAAPGALYRRPSLGTSYTDMDVLEYGPRRRMMTPRMANITYVTEAPLNPMGKLDHFTEHTLGPNRDVETIGLRKP